MCGKLTMKILYAYTNTALESLLMLLLNRKIELMNIPATIQKTSPPALQIRKKNECFPTENFTILEHSNPKNVYSSKTTIFGFGDLFHRALLDQLSIADRPLHNFGDSKYVARCFLNNIKLADLLILSF